VVEVDRERDANRREADICQQYKGVGQTGENTQGEMQPEKRNERERNFFRSTSKSSRIGERVYRLQKEKSYLYLAKLEGLIRHLNPRG